MKNPFHLEELDDGVDLLKSGMVNFESSNFAANLPESRAVIPDVKSMYIAKEKTYVKSRN